ncbi:hypothetical protein A2631_05230 [Candidatus Daviesbacteria bacterium RIFCSPHIGHO2_01_FULL_44_29]|uniref:SbsA Ig-like domain-containing protein n=1 Tax=Candidatus Daviesbacteria bacterium RIFCSPHIGHO2_02_FULL_43_12 TaxID=1797776 RepID=A0A1F5KGS0_9BACT|nr:MAG: hypothetical protein A2631_05230 [Candidatus Daviesbacteria bacterium RIFCSPHIGHO2_01_FULL_44_29]OGE40122.1 MAG: hypothetical protein A3D25_04950 [Candidatus Daviesbacteria bacterium RIFCSPHIGHO2_02_FULL_43_12]OGE41071.1 MAG: hypothetical protein A3E86_05055 [Candidatus Daviesbacteria bacterium RIFCSPHIGHO2_12_FULL_47_45]OGE70197.1 MAG: hypothetical protein A3B55_00610 [Candidatus Daviesbacteria bacterium RIFCSPLOWO2_01_FULL_43_15]
MNFWEIIKQYRLTVLLLFCAGLVGTIFLTLLFAQPKKPSSLVSISTPSNTTQPNQSPAGNLDGIQQPFQITTTTPQDLQTNIYPGEIELSFNTNQPILSEKSFSLNISPQLPFYLRLTNAYPTQTITARIFGGLTKNTTYTVSVSNTSGELVKSWQFTTSSEQNESSSSLVQEAEQQYNQQYFPLFSVTPYSEEDFEVDYKGKLELNVLIKTPNTAVGKQEFLNWMKSQGGDPSTHKINYLTK